MAMVDLKFVPDDELAHQLVGSGLTLNDLAGWHISAHRWAQKNGFLSGFPTFLWDRSPGETNLDKYRWKIVCVTTEYAELQTVKEVELLETVPDLTTLKYRHMAAHRWATSNGFSSGFPTHDQGNELDDPKHLILCFSDRAVDLREAKEEDLQRYMYPFFDFNKPNGRQAAAHYWAKSTGFVSGYPTYEQHSEVQPPTHVTVCLKSSKQASKQAEINSIL